MERGDLPSAWKPEIVNRTIYNLLKRIRAYFRKPAMTGSAPSERPMWHDPAQHARDFAERYAEPMNYHVENRMMELGIPTDRIGARKYGHPHRAFWPEETTGGGNVPGRRLTVDSGVFNARADGQPPRSGGGLGKVEAPR